MNEAKEWLLSSRASCTVLMHISLLIVNHSFVIIISGSE